MPASCECLFRVRPHVPLQVAFITLTVSGTRRFDLISLRYAAAGMESSDMEHQQKHLESYTYKILNRIGSGGMAEVYRALMVAPGSAIEKQVALKKILPNVARNEQFRRNFINEALICGQLRHPNIVEVFNFHRDGNDLYLSMEFIDGVSLDDVFEDYRKKGVQFSSNELIAIVSQILEGLDYAHNATTTADGTNEKTRLDIIHRDLKPSNILMNVEGLVKIVDFGVAKAANRRFETVEMTTKGTASYMAPEQIIGEPPVSTRSDLFSVGAILYEFLTLQRLFDGNNVFAILKLVSDMDIDEHLAKKVTGADRKFLPMLKKALARDPMQRYESAAEMLKALQALHIPQADSRHLGYIVQSVRPPDEQDVEDAKTRVVSYAARSQSAPKAPEPAPAHAPAQGASRDGDDEDESGATIMAGDIVVPPMAAPRPQPAAPSSGPVKALEPPAAQRNGAPPASGASPSLGVPAGILASAQAAAAGSPRSASKPGVPVSAGVSSAPSVGAPVSSVATSGANTVIRGAPGGMSGANGASATAGEGASGPAQNATFQSGATLPPTPSVNTSTPYVSSRNTLPPGSATSPLNMPGVPPIPAVSQQPMREYSGPAAQPAPTLHLTSVNQKQQSVMPALMAGAFIGGGVLFILYLISRFMGK